MRHSLAIFALVAGSYALHAQAPSAAPAGATGICKDGTYSTAASKDGACRGHKGVQTWYAATAAAPAPAAAQNAPALPAPRPATAAQTLPAPVPATSAATAAPAASRRSPSAALANKPAAAGGGPGLVWVNSSTNVYHCNGDDFYGKTKNGTYMSEADAKSKGARAARGQVCTGK